MITELQKLTMKLNHVTKYKKRTALQLIIKQQEQINVPTIIFFLEVPALLARRKSFPTASLDISVSVPEIQCKH